MRKHEKLAWLQRSYAMMRTLVLDLNEERNRRDPALPNQQSMRMARDLSMHIGVLDDEINRLLEES